jgi:hypothetical protein
MSRLGARHPALQTQGGLRLSLQPSGSGSRIQGRNTNSVLCRQTARVLFLTRSCPKIYSVSVISNMTHIPNILITVSRKHPRNSVGCAFRDGRCLRSSPRRRNSPKGMSPLQVCYLRGHENRHLDQRPSQGRSLPTSGLYGSVCDYWENLNKTKTSYKSYSANVGFSKSCYSDRCLGDFGVLDKVRLILKKHAHPGLYSQWYLVSFNNSFQVMILLMHPVWVCQLETVLRLGTCPMWKVGRCKCSCYRFAFSA